MVGTKSSWWRKKIEPMEVLRPVVPKHIHFVFHFSSKQTEQHKTHTTIESHRQNNRMSKIKSEEEINTTYHDAPTRKPKGNGERFADFLFAASLGVGPVLAVSLLHGIDPLTAAKIAFAGGTGSAFFGYQLSERSEQLEAALDLLSKSNSQNAHLLSQLERLVLFYQSEHASPLDCKVCAERPVSTVLHPCMHVGLCDECANNPRMNRICPFCREAVTKVEKVYPQ